MIDNKPYCFLQFDSAGISRLFVKAQAGAPYTFELISSGPTPSTTPTKLYSLSPSTHTFAVRYTLVTTGAGSSTIEDEIILDSSIGYDPRFEFIEVYIDEVMPDMTRRPKGKGTTTEEDADSSDGLIY